MALLPLIVGLVLFLGVHAFTMCRGARVQTIEWFGAKGYRGLYSLLAIVGLALIVWGFGHYRSAGMIAVWYPPFWARHLTFALVLIAFVLLATSHAPSHIRAWVKHPMITGVVLWSLGHLLANGDLGSILLFGGFLLWGVLARASMAMRAASDIQGPAPVRVPLWRADVITVVAGIVLWLVFLLWLHRLLIGVPLVAM
jgi:uncharacterized membrane protein